MRFMLMIKGNKQTEAGVLPSKRLMYEMIRYNDTLLDAGVLLAAEGLHPSSMGALVKFTEGRPAVSNGPFAEGRDIIAGYWLIQAKSKQTAVEWAKRIPFEAGESGANGGNIRQIEVRQVFGADEFAAHFTPALAMVDEHQRQLIAARQWPPEY